MWLLLFTLSIFLLIQPSSYYWIESITILKTSNPTCQPACLEEKFLLFDQAMVGSHTCHSPRYNSPPSGKNELTGSPSKAFTENSNIFTLFPTISWAQILAPAAAPALALSSTKELYQQLLKTYTATVKLLKQNHGLDPCKQPLKTQFPNLYYRNSHMDCYRFCQKCKDYFKTVRISRPNCIPFAASFFRESVV